MPVQDSFILLKKIYNVADEDYKRRIQFLDNMLDIGELMKIPVRKLSLGQRMRCEFAGSLIHWPDVIYLDEPTIGLDILTKKRVLSFVKELNEQYQKTIIFTTHNMHDIEDLCDRVILIDKGLIMYDGKIQELKASYNKQKVLSITFRNVIELDKQNLLEIVERFGQIKDIHNNNLILHIEDGGIDNIRHVLDKMNEICVITDYSISSFKFEDIIENIYLQESK